MKKLLFLSLVSCFFFVGQLSSALAGTPGEDLLDAMKHTMSDEYTGTGSFSFGMNEMILMDAAFESSYYHGDMEAHTDYSGSFDLTYAAEHLDPTTPVMIGTFTAGEDIFYRDSNANLWYRMHDLDFSVAGDGGTNYPKRIGEGVFELVKFLEGKYLFIDLEETSSMFSGLLGYEAEEFSGFIENALSNHEELSMEVWERLIASKMIRVTRLGNEITVTLETDPDVIKPQELYDLARYFGISEEEISSAKADFENDSRAAFIESWAEVAKNLQLEIVFFVSGDYITSTRMSITAHIDYPVWGWDETTYEYILKDTASLDISFSGMMFITQNADRISFPPVSGDTIDLTKYFDALLAIYEWEMEQWDTSYDYSESESWPSTDVYYGEESYGLTLEEMWNDIDVALSGDMEMPEGTLSRETRRWIAGIELPLRTSMKYLVLLNGDGTFLGSFQSTFDPDAILTTGEMHLLFGMFADEYYLYETADTFPVSKQTFLDYALSTFYPELGSYYTFENWNDIYADAEEAGITDSNLSGNYDSITQREAFTILARVLYSKYYPRG